MMLHIIMMDNKNSPSHWGSLTPVTWLVWSDGQKSHPVLCAVRFDRLFRPTLKTCPSRFTKVLHWA